MREIFNFFNFGKEKKKKRNIEVSKNFNFGNLKIYNLEENDRNLMNLRKINKTKFAC